MVTVVMMTTVDQTSDDQEQKFLTESQVADHYSSLNRLPTEYPTALLSEHFALRLKAGTRAVADLLKNCFLRFLNHFKIYPFRCKIRFVVYLEYFEIKGTT